MKNASCSTTLIFYSAALTFFPLSDAAAHGDYHDKVRGLTAQLSVRGNDASVRFELAKEHEGHDEFDLALAEADAVDLLEPGKHPTNWLRAKILNKQNRWTEAEALLNSQLESMPGHPDSLFQRGSARLKLGNKDAAIADFQAAVAKSNQVASPDFYATTARVLLESGLFGEAVEIVRTGLSAHSSEMDLIILAVDTGAAAKEYDFALQNASRLESLWPVPGIWTVRRAELLAAAGRTDEASSTWRGLLKQLENLPNLERGKPVHRDLIQKCRKALDLPVTTDVVAPPATH